MTISIALQFVVVLAAIWMGARFGGVGLGLWGAVGLLILVVAFGVNPTSPPVEVMLIILAVIELTALGRVGGYDSPLAKQLFDKHRDTIVAGFGVWFILFVIGYELIIGAS